MKKASGLPQSRIASQNSTAGGHAVFSLEDFKALVRYERARSDRCGSVFSIILFTIGEESHASPEAVIQRISGYSRSIDCVGWDSGGQISVLLPDTIKQGADSFGRKVQAELEEEEKCKVLFDVYCYPENWQFSEKSGLPSGREGKPLDSSQREHAELFFIDKVPVWKRSLDIVGSSLLLIGLSPVFLLLAIYIKVVSPGPAFFKQTRVGYKGIPFTFWKFRTMKCSNDQSLHGNYAKSFIRDGDTPMEKLDSRDPRIIPGGKAIRKSCMDELPQLWNVLRGEMSLVGPRPCIPYEAMEYLRWHTHRFDVLPGLSGLWQVSGKSKLTFKQMVRLDIEYCSNITLWGDLKILIRTPFAIIKMVFESIANRISLRYPRMERTQEPRRGMQFFR
jgi:lipopolysaccharide/colanic/teichoic acid biosynthesis glycosyltransferase